MGVDRNALARDIALEEGPQKGVEGVHSSTSGSMIQSNVGRARLWLFDMSVTMLFAVYEARHQYGLLH